MKRVTATWSETETYEFPDDAPIHNPEELGDYVENHPKALGDWNHFCIHYEVGDKEFEL